jgi:phospholipid/cholesterol/gamma-HCH transport system ATP-binding protein
MSSPERDDREVRAAGPAATAAAGLRDGQRPAAAATPLFALRGLTKRYGRRTVLDGIDLEMRRGECFVIMGRSGTGKSVCLRQLNGLEKPDEGHVLFEGENLSLREERDLYPLRRRVAMLFQGGALFDSMDVFDNVAFPLREHRRDLPGEEVAAAVREKLAMVQLTGVERKMPSDLSGGMRKRVALARSLVLEPEVVLFDEPTTGLDPMTSAAIANLVRRVQRDLGITPIVVTHDIHLARIAGDRLGFLDHGKFRFVGTWEEAEGGADPLFARFLAGQPEEEVD